MNRAVKIVVPDDFPPALTGSVAEAPLKKDGPGARVHRARGGSGSHPDRAYRRRRRRPQHPRPRPLHRPRAGGLPRAAPDLRSGARARTTWIWSLCKARGVTVTNTPGVNANALAEHTIALMLAVTRRIPAMDRDVRAGQWPRGLLTQLEGRPGPRRARRHRQPRGRPRQALRHAHARLNLRRRTKERAAALERAARARRAAPARVRHRQPAPETERGHARAIWARSGWP